MKDTDREIAPLIRAYILIDQINSQKNVNNSNLELKSMCKFYGDEFSKNVNLISYNHIDFKNIGNQEKEIESFFTLNFPAFIGNEKFVKIFGNLLMDAKNDYTVSEIFNGLKKKFNLNIEQQIKLILSFIDSRIEKYVNDANLLFLEKCTEIYEQKMFLQIKEKNIIDYIINELFNILKIKNRQENKDANNEKDIVEENIKLYIQSFSHYNEQLKTDLVNKENNANALETEEKNKIECDLNLNSINTIDNKIEYEKLIYDLGPFIINHNIDLTNIPYINIDLDLNRFTKFILFILNNHEMQFTKGMKYLNKIFLEAMHMNPEYLNLIESIPTNEVIPWDINSIYKLFQISLNNIDKQKLLLSLDNPYFIMDTKKRFDLFSDILIKLHFFGEDNNLNVNNNKLFFENFLFIKWKNIPNQLKFLELLITNKEISDNSIFSLKNYQGQKIKKDIELRAYTSSKNHYLIDNWRNVKLIETLLLISDGDNYNSVKRLLDWALKNIPEIIIMGLLVIKIDYNENILMKDLILEILPSILNDKNPRLKLIDEIWQKNKDIVIFTLYNSWKNFPDLMNLSLIFDLSNSLLKDSLLPLVNSKYHNFSVHLGLLASKRDYLHVEQWLKKSIEKYGDDFINSLLDYLKINIIQPCQTNFNLNENNKANILEKAQLSLESLSIILNTLNSYNTQNENNSNVNGNNKITSKTKNEIEKINKIIFDIYDEIKDEQINSEEIENEVSQLLRSMLEEKISVDNIVNLLINYKSSNDKKQNEIYSCLIHGLLAEYSYYSQYPKKKLKLFSELFGKIINSKLLEGIIETLALNYILEGIKSGSELLYFFGITALSQFIGKISHWPSYMKKLLDLEILKKDNKNLYMLILQENEKIQKKNNSEKSGDNNDKCDKLVSLISVSHSENKSIEDYVNTNTSINNENINSINKSKDSKEKENETVDRLKNKLSGVTKSFMDCEYNNNYQNNNNNNNNNDDQRIELPMEEIINKTKIIFDSLNKTNILEKSLEITKLLGNDEKTIRWFSYYFITTKINHWKNIPFRMFNELFIQINNPLLSKYMLKDTIKYIQELLSLDCLYIDEKCKNLLKNLGTWLGFNTLSKNRPILAKDIDFRELISNSYKNGELNTIIPFICKVFSFVSKTKIFNINNPWINSILSLLKEIYHKSLLSFTLKKEIESFFESVKIEMSSITNSTKYLNKISRLDSKNHDFPDFQKYQINIDIKELTKKISSLNDYINNLLNILNNDKNIVSGFYYNNKNYNYFNNLTENESGDNDNNLSNNTHKNIDNQKEIISILTNIMNQSILDAIPDLITIYVEKPINSAITIVNKDFTFESDVIKYRTALHNTLQFILKSFSIIGAHDKLKINIDANFDKYYKAKKLKKETINKIKELPNSEYINIGLEYIQIFIMKEAKNTLNLNKKVIDEIDKRKQGNLNLSKNDFYKDYITKVKHKMPLILKPNEEHIKDNEYKIYENFKTNGFKLYEEDSSKSSFLNTVYRILKEVIDKAAVDNSQNKISTYKNYDLCMKNIQNISKKNAFYNYDEDQQLSCLKKIIVDSKIEQTEICTQLALNTFKYIMDSIKINNFLLLNAYIYILRGWVKLNSDIYNKITQCLFEYDTDIFSKFKYELHLYLIKQKVLDHHLYEMYMVNLLCGSSVKNTIIQNLLNHLLANHSNNSNNNQKNLFGKIKYYYYDKKSDNFYLLFNKRSNILNSLANNYNSDYKTKNQLCENNENKEQIEAKNNHIYYFVNIIQYFYHLLFNSNSNSDLDNNHEFDYDYDNDEILKNVNMYSLNDLLNITKEIYDLCINKSYDENCTKYINFFYPENLSIFIYYIIFLNDEFNKNDKEQKIILFNNLLDIVISLLHQDYLIKKVYFNQKKYYKFFINLISLISNKSDINNKDNIQNNENLKMDYLITICDKLKLLSPMNYPGFAIAWLDLISCNYFIQNFLDTNLIKENSYKYEKYLSLLTEVLSYLNILKNQRINNYYFKVFLDKMYTFFYILSNTYSAFIASYSNILIPYLSLSSLPKDEDNNSFLQLKNIILSATPLNIVSSKDNNNHKDINKNFYKENFFSIKVYKENLVPNKIICLLFDNNDDNIQNEEDMELNILLDKYINEKADENSLEAILNYFDTIKDERQLINTYNGIMMYWCHKKQKHITENKIKSKKVFYNFYYFLLCNLDEIQKKYLIDSILNALRFPCSQAISYSILFQELFINLDNEDIEKQLMENILERMIYYPIPWGIKYTLHGLINNEKYQKLEKKYINNNIEVVDFLNKITNNLMDNANELKNNI